MGVIVGLDDGTAVTGDVVGEQDGEFVAKIDEGNGVGRKVGVFVGEWVSPRAVGFIVGTGVGD